MFDLHRYTRQFQSAFDNRGTIDMATAFPPTFVCYLLYKRLVPPPKAASQRIMPIMDDYLYLLSPPPLPPPPLPHPPFILLPSPGQET